MTTVLHDPIVKPDDRTHGVFLDGVLKVRSNKTGAGQFAKGMRKNLRECEEVVTGRVVVKPIKPETFGETFARMERELALGSQAKGYDDPTEPLPGTRLPGPDDVGPTPSEKNWGFQ